MLDWIEKPDASKDLEEEFKQIWLNIKVKPGDYTKWSGKIEKVHERLEMEELYGSLNLETKQKIRYKTKDRPPKTSVEKHQYAGKYKMRNLVYGVFVTLIILMLVVFYNKTPMSKVEAPLVEQMEKHTEPGQKLSFHLDDGTRVMLNSGSALSYPASFDSLERKVILAGEAFFEVSKDVHRPFMVVTESVVTTALGTSFNINAFSMKYIEIALVSGRVSVQNLIQFNHADALILNPGEMATVLKSDYSIDKSSFNFNEKVSWKYGVIYFKEADYYEIVSKLENWYGVRIQADTPPAKSWKFSGKFENETLENILIALQFGHDFEYRIKGTAVKLNF